MGGLPPFAGALSNGEVAQEQPFACSIEYTRTGKNECHWLIGLLRERLACYEAVNDPRGVGGRVQGLAGPPGVFDVVGVAAWAFSRTFTILVVVPRLSNSMWT